MGVKEFSRILDWLKSQDKVNKILISVSIVLALIVGIFGVFAISQGGQQGGQQPEGPSEEQAPAEFEVSNLSISPSEIEPGQTVTISVNIKNTGDVSGMKTVEFDVDGETKMKDVTLESGESKNVPISITKQEEGIYNVGISGMSESFEVKFLGANIEILSTYSYTDSIGYPTVVGEVKNKGNKNANYVKILATFYDSSGELIGSTYTYTELDIVKAGQKAPFKTSLLKDVAFDSVETQVQWNTTSEEPYDKYKILDHFCEIDSIGYYEVTGEVKNTGDRERNYNKIVATFYDSTGKVIASEYTYTELDTLSPGQKSPFTITVLNEDISILIESYSLIVQS